MKVPPSQSHDSWRTPFLIPSTQYLGFQYMSSTSKYSAYYRQWKMHELSEISCKRKVRGGIHVDRRRLLLLKTSSPWTQRRLTKRLPSLILPYFLKFNKLQTVWKIDKSLCGSSKTCFTVVIWVLNGMPEWVLW